MRERDTTGEPRVLASAGNPVGTHGPFLLVRGHLIGGGGRTAMKAQADDASAPVLFGIGVAAADIKREGKDD